MNSWLESVGLRRNNRSGGERFGRCGVSSNLISLLLYNAIICTLKRVTSWNAATVCPPLAIERAGGGGGRKPTGLLQFSVPDPEIDCRSNGKKTKTLVVHFFAFPSGHLYGWQNDHHAVSSELCRLVAPATLLMICSSSDPLAIQRRNETSALPTFRTNQPYPELRGLDTSPKMPPPPAPFSRQAGLRTTLLSRPYTAAVYMELSFVGCVIGINPRDYLPPRMKSFKATIDAEVFADSGTTPRPSCATKVVCSQLAAY